MNILKLVIVALCLQASITWSAVVTIKSTEDIKMYQYHEGQIRVMKCAAYTFVEEVGDCLGNDSFQISKMEEDNFFEMKRRSILKIEGIFPEKLEQYIEIYNTKGDEKKLIAKAAQLTKEKEKLEKFINHVGSDNKIEAKLEKINNELLDTKNKLSIFSNSADQISKIDDFINMLMAKLKLEVYAPDEINTYVFNRDSNTPIYKLLSGYYFSSMSPQLSSGSDVTCGIRPNTRDIKCWGSTNTADIDPPAAMINPISIFSGENHTCSIAENGLFCWGNSSNGKTTAPKNLLNISAGGAGDYHTCVIADSKVSCWGGNPDGQLDVPNSLNFVTELAAGDEHNCAIGAGVVECWGDNQHNQSDVPFNLSNPRGIAAGAFHTCTITDSGVVCWGKDSSGQATVPAGLINPRGLAMGDGHTCVITDLGVKCWGGSSDGKLIAPTFSGYIKEIAAGYFHTCGMTETEMKCWGRTSNNRTVPPMDFFN